MLGGITLTSILGFSIGALIGFTLHEWAHAWTAVRLGDNTPRYAMAPQVPLFGGRMYLGGRDRLSLDPRAHIDPLGFLLAVLFGFGWARPVPVNPRAFYPNERRGLMMVSLAGPVMNLVIAFVIGTLLALVHFIGIIPYRGFFYEIIYYAIRINIVLLLFNLVPLYPLDGWKIMLGLLPPEQARQIEPYEREAMFALLIIIIIGAINPFFDPIWLILGPFVEAIFRLVTWSL